MPYRVIFMGSPKFALPTLHQLASHYHVVGVVTQPDRPAGRGRKLEPPAVKLLALDLQLPIIQPLRLKELDAMTQLQAWQSDLIVVAAFGQILRPNVLDLPRFGCINIHASLLPRWRGTSPIQAAILNGDYQTGVTIMRMDVGLDTGPIISQRSIDIEPEDTAGTLSEKLAILGAQLLVETLPGYLAGVIQPHSQDETSVTKTSLLNKEDGQLNFTMPAEFLARQVRAFFPWPGTYFTMNNEVIKVLRAHAVEQISIRAGQPLVHGKFPAIGTPTGLLVLDIVQPPGKKSMPGDAFLRGNHQWAG
jgi:methionyl-tRNA formyltransferase